MVMTKPPKKFLVDSFEYKEPGGRNDWGEPTYGETVEIKNCRIDREAEYTSAASGRELLYSAVIFCYSGLTEPLPEFKTEGIITFDGEEHRIGKVIPVKEPYVDQIFSYELEVL